MIGKTTGMITATGTGAIDNGTSGTVTMTTVTMTTVITATDTIAVVTTTTMATDDATIGRLTLGMAIGTATVRMPVFGWDHFASISGTKTGFVCCRVPSSPLSCEEGEVGGMVTKDRIEGRELCVRALAAG